MLDPEHELSVLAGRLDWNRLTGGLAADHAATDLASIPVRLLVGLHLLKLIRGLGDEDVCAAWCENPYFQAFCGEDGFRHRLPLAVADLARWRTQSDWAAMSIRLADALAATGALTTGHRPAATFVVDFDGVIGMLTPGNDYRLSQPIQETIAALNRLYDQGHRIVLLTARGSATGIDWSEVTRGQLERWGVKYHELHFGKPAADYYIDDRMITVDMLCAMGWGRPFPPSSRAPRVAGDDGSA